MTFLCVLAQELACTLPLPGPDVEPEADKLQLAETEPEQQQAIFRDLFPTMRHSDVLIGQQLHVGYKTFLIRNILGEGTYSMVVE